MVCSYVSSVLTEVKKEPSKPGDAWGNKVDVTKRMKQEVRWERLMCGTADPCVSHSLLLWHLGCLSVHPS